MPGGTTDGGATLGSDGLRLQLFYNASVVALTLPRTSTAHSHQAPQTARPSCSVLGVHEGGGVLFAVLCAAEDRATNLTQLGFRLAFNQSGSQPAGADVAWAAGNFTVTLGLGISTPTSVGEL